MLEFYLAPVACRERSGNFRSFEIVPKGIKLCLSRSHQGHQGLAAVLSMPVT